MCVCMYVCARVRVCVGEFMESKKLLAEQRTVETCRAAYNMSAFMYLEAFRYIWCIFKDLRRYSAFD